MRERIASDGIRSLHDHEVLEYLLFPFVPRRNTNEIAHRLMEKFGTFSEVFNADAADLAAVSGMTENAALFFSVLPEVLRPAYEPLLLENTNKLIHTAHRLLLVEPDRRVHA